MNPIKTALASFGMSGRVFHGPFLKLNPGFEVVKILERSKNESKEMFPNALIVREFKEILTDSSIELIIVNTPNYLHYEMTKQALLADKHVVVEKPFTTTVSEGKELIELAHKKELVLSVYQNRRLDSDFKTIQKLLNENQLGEVKRYEARFDRYRSEIGPKKWKEEQYDGAGILYDLGSHLIDQALQLFGKPKSYVVRTEIQRKGGVVPDFFEATLSYPDLVVLLTAGMLVKDHSLRYKIKGTKGEYIKHGLDPQEKRLVDGDIPTGNGWGQEPEEIWGMLNEVKIRSEKGSYQDYYQNIYEVIREQKSLLVPPIEALEVIKIIESEKS